MIRSNVGMRSEQPEAQVEYRGDGPAKIDQPFDDLWRAGQWCNRDRAHRLDDVGDGHADAEIRDREGEDVHGVRAPLTPRTRVQLTVQPPWVGGGRFVPLTYAMTNTRPTFHSASNANAAPTRSAVRAALRIAGGRHLERPVGIAIVHAAGMKAPDYVVFAEPTDMIILGARTLEGMNVR